MSFSTGCEGGTYRRRFSAAWSLAAMARRMADASSQARPRKNANRRAENCVEPRVKREISSLAIRNVDPSRSSFIRDASLKLTSSRSTVDFDAAVSPANSNSSTALPSSSSSRNELLSSRYPARFTPRARCRRRHPHRRWYRSLFRLPMAVFQQVDGSSVLAFDNAQRQQPLQQADVGLRLEQCSCAGAVVVFDLISQFRKHRRQMTRAGLFEMFGKRTELRQFVRAACPQAAARPDFPAAYESAPKRRGVPPVRPARGHACSPLQCVVIFRDGFRGPPVDFARLGSFVLEEDRAHVLLIQLGLCYRLMSQGGIIPSLSNRDKCLQTVNCGQIVPGEICRTGSQSGTIHLSVRSRTCDVASIAKQIERNRFGPRLPASAANIATAISARRLKGRAVRILVVEDYVDAAMSLAMLLTSSGHEVDVAYDGMEGVQSVIQSEPDVIILDIGLPKLDGFEVAKRIRGRSRHWPRNV